MDVLKQFECYIVANKLIGDKDKVLLAVSGGKDSMLMLWLFIQAGISVEVAHCNFSLRGAESDADEKLVCDYALKFGLFCHVKRFDTENYAKSKKMSIQMAARELRYNWFEQLRAKHGFDSVAIAQHTNDHVETLLFNLSRGTGLKGLIGIRRKRESVIRPLLFLKSKEIAQFVFEKKIPYRDDLSNFSNKYARNKIRLDIIPQFEQLNRNFINNMDENIVKFQESVEVLDDFVNELREQIFQPIGESIWRIAKTSISGRKIGVIYLLFEPYNFNKNVLEDMLLALDKESGRIFESNEFIILSDREHLILKRKRIILPELLIYPQEDLLAIEWGAYVFKLFFSEDCCIEHDSNLAKIDVSKLVYPLKIRSWNQGDVFQPLGMKGKKKVSDFFIQQKLSLFEKDELAILFNGNGDIIWIVGFRLDDRYKITQKTKKVLKLVFHKK